MNSVYIRDADGSPAVRLGDGVGMALSPDERWALSIILGGAGGLQLLPVGAGETKQIPVEGLKCNSAGWFPDGKSLCLLASEPSQGLKLYRADLEGSVEKISDEEVGGQEIQISRNGRWIVVFGKEGEWMMHSAIGDELRLLRGIPYHARVIGWSEDDRSIFYFLRGRIPAVVFRLDLETGERSHWVDIEPPSPAGVPTLSRVVMTPNGEFIAFGYPQFLTTLYVVEGIH